MKLLEEIVFKIENFECHLQYEMNNFIIKCIFYLITELLNVNPSHNQKADLHVIFLLTQSSAFTKFLLEKSTKFSKLKNYKLFLWNRQLLVKNTKKPNFKG